MRRNGYPPPVSTRLDWPLYEYLRLRAGDGNVSEYLKGLVAADAIEHAEISHPAGGQLMRLVCLIKARLKAALQRASLRRKLRVIEPLSELLRRILKEGSNV